MPNGKSVLKLGKSLPGKGKSSIKQISKLEITTIFVKKLKNTKILIVQKLWIL